MDAVRVEVAVGVGCPDVSEVRAVALAAPGVSEPVIRIVGPGEGQVYSPNEVPPSINMSLEEWQALSDTQRQMIGDRRFASPPEVCAVCSGPLTREYGSLMCADKMCVAYRGKP